MPMLKISGASKEQIRQLSATLIDELVVITGSPKDYFTLELSQNAFFVDGKEIEAPLAQVEILMFERPQAEMDKIAQAVTKGLNQLGVENVDVFFVFLQTRAYYENGQHF